jgi:hypothetical protein
MRCLSFSQPFGTLVAIGAKNIETRSWSTKYRGKIAIHTSATIPAVYKTLCAVEPFKSLLSAHGYQLNNLPLGQVIAVCDLVDCIKIPALKTFYPAHRRGEYLFSLPPDEPELSLGDYTPGRYAWVLRNVKVLPTPILARGSLGLWRISL